MSYRPCVSVDFDGVLHDYTLGWNDGILADIDTSLIARLHEAGYAVCISTCRTVSKVDAVLRSRGFQVVADRQMTRAFWDGGPDGYAVLVTNRKVAAVAYIDDRAVHYRYEDRDARQEEVLVLVARLAGHSDGWKPSRRSGSDPMGTTDDLYRHGDPTADALPPARGDL